MNISEYIRNLENYIEDREQLRITNTLDVAFSVNALRKRRIINTGIAASGNPFATYAPKTQKIKEKKGQTRNPFPTMNFSDTNIMWNSTLPELVEANDNEVIVILKPQDSEREEVMGYHESRFGKEEFGLNEKEIELMETLFDEKIQGDFDQYGIS